MRQIMSGGRTTPRRCQAHVLVAAVCALALSPLPAYPRHAAADGQAGSGDQMAAADPRACQNALPADASEEDRRIACEIPQEYQDDVVFARVFGTALRRHDMAAWLTTDDLREKSLLFPLPDDAVAGMGWTSVENDDGIDVTYFYLTEEDIAVLAESTLFFEPFGARDSKRVAGERPPTVKERTLLRAVDTARRLPGLINCNPSRPFNSTALMVQTEQLDSIVVYLMSAWTEDVVPTGGFHAVQLRADDMAVLNVYSLTRECRGIDPQALQTDAPLLLTHDTSPTPTAFHVFLALQYRKTLWVRTAGNDLLWRVEGPTISLSAPDGIDTAASITDTEIPRDTRSPIRTRNGTSNTKASPP